MRRLSLLASLVALLAVVLVAPSSGAPPALRLDVPTPVEATSPAGASVTYHVKAYDPVSGNPISATCTGGSNSGDFDVTLALPIGSHTIHCDATLEDLSAVSEEKPVEVVDLTAPAFGAAPSIAPVEATAPGNTPVSFSNPVATDVVDGPITSVCNPSSGSGFAVGTTTVTCTATDTAGNSSGQSLTVTVTDTTDPVLGTGPTDQILEAAGPSGAVATFATPSATDNGDPAPNVSCGSPSGSTFPIGTTNVQCNASDASGNTTDTPVSFTIMVRDTTAPQLTLPANISAEATSPAGRVVTFSASASDLVAGSPLVTCAPPSGNTFPVGTTTVNCSATDPPAANTANGSSTVTVTDSSGPTFTGVSPTVHREANGPGGSVVTFPTPTATDAVEGPIAGASCSPGSGSTFPIGTTTVTCSASDSHGNAGSASFQVIVADTTPPSLIVPASRAASTRRPRPASPTTWPASIRS